MKTLHLSTNIRAHLFGDASSAEFAQNLLKIGEGKVLVDDNGLFDMGPYSTQVSNQDELMEQVFPKFSIRYKDPERQSERAILAPRNVAVNSINEKFLWKIPIRDIQYKSVDTVVDKTEATDYTDEFLNSLDISCVPPHNLKLQVGGAIMLLT